ncbi:hypothetical protein N026_11335 [Pseudomonas syringae UB303]|uniref:Uncharacterized protein n=1 Tax=Pseudomonas syringae UB303 TaxID=1357287 RepID=A0AAJ4BES8_PSESX|nr:hypothetical protein N026_11335 [Pseudomonas syringae UB303]
MGRGASSDLPDDYRSSRSSVRTPLVTLCVTTLRRTAHSRADAERPERQAHAECRHDSDLPDDYRSSRSSVGMPFVTLRVTTLRRTAHSRADAERRHVSLFRTLKPHSDRVQVSSQSDPYMHLESNRRTKYSFQEQAFFGDDCLATSALGR